MNFMENALYKCIIIIIIIIMSPQKNKVLNGLGIANSRPAQFRKKCPRLRDFYGTAFLREGASARRHYTFQTFKVKFIRFKWLIDHLKGKRDTADRHFGIPRPAYWVCSGFGFVIHVLFNLQVWSVNPLWQELTIKDCFVLGSDTTLNIVEFIPKRVILTTTLEWILYIMIFFTGFSSKRSEFPLQAYRRVENRRRYRNSITVLWTLINVESTRQKRQCHKSLHARLCENNFNMT